MIGAWAPLPGPADHQVLRDAWFGGKDHDQATAPLTTQSPSLPGGTVAFLFTDVEGSTRIWQRNPLDMGDALARHDTAIEGLVAERAGQLVRPRGEGDSRFAVFSRPSDAVACACAIQLAFLKERWPTPEPLLVRMAVHVGEADVRLGDYYGPSVNHCARLRGVAHGGQVLVSEVAAELVRESLGPEVSLRDLGVYHLKELDQPEHVWQLLHPALLSDFPPLAPAGLSSEVARPLTLSPLPLQLTSLVGRDEAIVEVTSLFQRSRLVTLTGPGGIGKTRLALEVARRIAEQDAAVGFVDLAPLHDPALVPHTVATSLGLREQRDCSALESLVDILRSRSLLLVLDNCEHILTACAALVEQLLRACAHVRILATSRASLGIAAETIWPVAPQQQPTTCA